MILGEDPKHDPLISRIITFSLVCPISMPAALRRPQKKHAAGILEHVPCDFFILGTFSLVCPMSMPVALRRPQKKHAPGILEHVPRVFC